MFYRFPVIVWFLFSGSSFGSDSQFSQEAWREILPIYKAIVEHPFNQELMKGTLPKNAFDYYSEQDSLFLGDFTKSLKLLATKLGDPSDVEKIMNLVAESAAEGKDDRGNKTPEPRAAPATLLYTSHLLRIAFTQSKEELAAALLPCYWIYLKLAEDLKGQTTASNPYTKWIGTYSSLKYRKSVNVMIELVDKLAGATTAETRSKMMDSFVLASRMEWYFWDGAYRMASWRP
jgi:thiaminase (transcriptional activator TenA)